MPKALTTSRAWTGPLEQIDAWRWRIPQSYDPGMRVPGLIFTDEALLRDIATDQSLQQVANVAHLPGIVKASMAMPDIHWGYGFPIGGVAAVDAQEGVISPGGIGYDINCLSGETEVLHAFGYRRQIHDIVMAEIREPTRTYALRPPEVQCASVTGGLRRRPTAAALELRTVTGRSIVATAEHPFLTPAGMKPLGGLQAGDRLAVDPFEGVPYEAPPHDVLVDEEAVRDFLRRLGKTRGNAVSQVLSDLRSRGLLPLRYDSAALPVFIKLLGFAIGDGTLYFLKRGCQGMVWWFGKAKDLETLRAELAPWWKASRVYQRRRVHRIRTDYGEAEFEAVNAACRVGSTGFAVLLALLGCPVGNKSTQDYGVPRWLQRAPLWQKRLFLASYFGAELQAPRAYARRNRNFPCPLLTVQKSEQFTASGRRFLEEIAGLAHEFGVETLGIDTHRERVRRKHGVSCRLRLLFSSRPKHLWALYARIGFEYNEARRAEAAVTAIYQSRKQRVWKDRVEAVSEILRLRQETGAGAKRIIAQLTAPRPRAGGGVNLRFVEHTLYGGEDRIVRVPEGFVSYAAFRQEATEGLGGSGLVWETIESIEPRDEVPWVYDIEVNHADHNFVANGFVVHNCGVRLVRTDLTVEEVQPKLKTLIATLFNAVPCGVGMSGDIRVSRAEAPKVMTQGSRWAVTRGYGTPDDLEHTESRGCLEGADPAQVSDRAIQRGHDQLGTLGSGNHFLEVQAVDTVYDEAAADAAGISPGQVTVMIHSGSRGFGYQICDDYLDVTGRAMAK
jgi:tRNA-splicing ligase RtcB